MESDLEQRFRAAFEAHADELFRHCHLRISDRERALELTQESFLRAWDYARKGGDIREYRAFLYRVLNNLIIDEYRKRKAQSLDALLEREETQVAVEAALLRDETDAIEEAMWRFDTARAVAALKELPESYRGVMVMRYVDGLSPGEIADCMRLSENAVSVRLHRGLKKMRDLLSQ